MHVKLFLENFPLTRTIPSDFTLMIIEALPEWCYCAIHVNFTAFFANNKIKSSFRTAVKRKTNFIRAMFSFKCIPLIYKSKNSISWFTTSLHGFIQINCLFNLRALFRILQISSSSQCHHGLFTEHLFCIIWSL